MAPKAPPPSPASSLERAGPGRPAVCGHPRPPRNVRRLVPAPLPTRGSTSRASASGAALQPGALSPAPLPARLGLQPQRHRRLAPPGFPTRAQPRAGPHAALERRLRRVSVPAPASPPYPLRDLVGFCADLENWRSVDTPANPLLVLTPGLLTTFLLFPLSRFLLEKVEGPGRAITRRDPPLFCLEMYALPRSSLWVWPMLCGLGLGQR